MEVAMVNITPPMDITGWFQVGWGKDFAPGSVTPMRFFGVELVAFRTEGGVLRVLDAYCEHLGAHLGYGGRVCGDRIVCPFHGWEWDGCGANVAIPYQDRPNRSRRIRPWPVNEVDEGVFVWHDALGRDPLWKLPDIFVDLTGMDGPDTVSEFYPAHPDGIARYDDLTLHPQFMLENAVDFAHFAFVHGTTPPPTIVTQSAEATSFRVGVDFVFGGGRETTWLTPDGPIAVRLHNMYSGVGLSYAGFEGGDRYRTLLGATPVDDQHTTLFHSIWVPRRTGDDGDRLPEPLHRRMADAKRQLRLDIDIWTHQRYTDPAGLATEEVKGFNAARRWARRFYPGSAEHLELGETATPHPAESVDAS
jgi:3-ketosteroid 9alpha-monooxygenase subunit A